MSPSKDFPKPEAEPESAPESYPVQTPLDSDMEEQKSPHSTTATMSNSPAMMASPTANSTDAANEKPEVCGEQNGLGLVGSTR
jgi:hypothetical protein